MNTPESRCAPEWVKDPNANPYWTGGLSVTHIIGCGAHSHGPQRDVMRRIQDECPMRELVDAAAFE